LVEGLVVVPHTRGQAHRSRGASEKVLEQTLHLFLVWVCLECTDKKPPSSGQIALPIRKPAQEGLGFPTCFGDPEQGRKEIPRSGLFPRLGEHECVLEP
jgi:hypothetical protein